MEVGVSTGETDFDPVAAAEETFGVEGLVDVADEVDDELVVVSGGGVKVKKGRREYGPWQL